MPPTTVIGSFPHTEPGPICERLVASLDLPAWPQLPRRSFYENMYVQYSACLPGIQIDPVNEKVYFNTTGDLAASLESFYDKVLAEDIDAFSLPENFAAGFYAMLGLLEGHHLAGVKGHITGPFSLGLTVTDQNLRASLYHPDLADAIVMNAAMGARWQVRTLKTVAKNVLLFVDEPYMASFGSAYISTSREAVITMLDEVFSAIHMEGGLAGVHCCGNTDWPVLLATGVDVLNLDAVEFLDSLALFPGELAAFLDRGGWIAWGILPNHAAIHATTPAEIHARLMGGLEHIAQRAAARDVNLPLDRLLRRSLITPACGLGSADLLTAEKVLETLRDMSSGAGYFFPE
jgi:methionine synthase II (cobalamin-independent)